MARLLDDWQVVFPMVKAARTDDGRLVIEGIASDESVDLENEIVKASGLLDTIPLLQERGVMDWNHGGAIIGRPTVVKHISREEAEMMFPEVYGPGGKTKLVGDNVLYVKAYLDEQIPGEPVNADLATARAAVINGYPLGFSLEGGRLKRGEAKDPRGWTYPSAEQVVATRVALCTCPMNQNTFARMAKSLSAAMSMSPGAGTVTVIEKGLMAGTGADAAAFTGGRALVPEGMGDGGKGSLAVTTWGCPECGREFPGGEENGRCPDCDVELAGITGRKTSRKRRAPFADLTRGGHKSMSNKQWVKKGVALVGQLGRLFGKAMDAEDELEDEDDEVSLEDPGVDNDVNQEDALPTDEELEDLLDEIDESDHVTDEELEDLLDESDESDDVTDEDGDEDEEYEEEEDDDEEVPMKKSIVDELRADPEFGQVVAGDKALQKVLSAYDKRIAGRMTAMEKGVGTIAAAVQTILEAQLAAAGVAEEQRATEGAKPAGGYRIAKGMKDGKPPVADEAMSAEDAEVLLSKAVHANIILPKDHRALQIRMARQDPSVSIVLKKVKAALAAAPDAGE
jgi:hypothetical protein